MKMNDQCLPCLVNQVVKIAHMTQVKNKNELYQKIFAYMSQMDFDKTNPEIIGEIFRLLKKHTDCDDPYLDMRKYYNRLFLKHFSYFDSNIQSFEDAVKHAIIANVIDFTPVHQNVEDNIMNYFHSVNQLKMTINHIPQMIKSLQQSKTLLYLGDNCGEICFDFLLIKRIKEMNPNLHIYFGVRGAPVINDNIEEDAYEIGMDSYATIISNGDDSLGTILSRVSEEFLDIYQHADMIIAKGQANFESLSEDNKNIYFLLMVKCQVIASYIGVEEKSLVCLSHENSHENS